ncbi:uncharacterized protein LOC132012353 [Mustela nigripes]|uniref:uncharacterized protein LOC132012353 n=1 Tax=Mustela nigripes TaxID=77151 RepID=UPI002815FF71|nr:uncharacterized protein LOC132012353 [Mustela nigripes]
MRPKGGTRRTAPAGSQLHCQRRTVRRPGGVGTGKPGRADLPVGTSRRCAARIQEGWIAWNPTVRQQALRRRNWYFCPLPPSLQSQACIGGCVLCCVLGLQPCTSPLSPTPSRDFVSLLKKKREWSRTCSDGFPLVSSGKNPSSKTSGSLCTQCPSPETKWLSLKKYFILLTAKQADDGTVLMPIRTAPKHSSPKREKLASE